MKSNERTPRNPGNIKVSMKAGQDHDESAAGTETAAPWPLEPDSYQVICANETGSTIHTVVEDPALAAASGR
jgi:hypothetical protein